MAVSTRVKPAVGAAACTSPLQSASSAAIGM